MGTVSKMAVLGIHLTGEFWVQGYVTLSVEERFELKGKVKFNMLHHLCNTVTLFGVLEMYGTLQDQPVSLKTCA